MIPSPPFHLLLKVILPICLDSGSSVNHLESSHYLCLSPEHRKWKLHSVHQASTAFPAMPAGGASRVCTWQMSIPFHTRGLSASAVRTDMKILPGQNERLLLTPWRYEKITLFFNCSYTVYVEKEMATHSSVLACRIPGTGEPGGLLSMGSHRVGHDWSDLAASAATYCICLSPLEVCKPPESKVYDWFTCKSLHSAKMILNSYLTCL